VNNEIPNTKRELENALMILFATFGQTATPNQLRGYVLALRNLSLDQIKVAVDKAGQQCKRLPVPADLIALSGFVTLERQSALAWQAAVDSVVAKGPYKNVDFHQDRIINATIRNLGGWDSFISQFKNAESEKWLRREFIRVYEAFSGCLDENSDQCAWLPGLTTVDPPVIHPCDSVTSTGRLNHAKHTELPQPTTQSKPSVGMLQGVN
jgi:hypothetical protein